MDEIMEKEQTVRGFTELTISEEASLSGGDIFVLGGYAVGGSVGVDGYSDSPVGGPGVVIVSDPFPILKDLGKVFSKTKVD